MSRRTAAAHKQSHARSLAAVYDDQPTKPLPTVTLFDLIAETRRLEAATAQEADADRTLTIDAAQRERLVAAALASDLDLEPPPVTVRHPADDDAPTLHAPSLLHALPSIELAPTPPVDAPAASGIRPRITLEQSREARSNGWLPNGSTETWIVAGIWAMAISLIAVLMVIAS